jgi:hypothetical protein
VRIAIKVERVHEIPCGVMMVLDQPAGERPVLWVRSDVPESTIARVLDAVQREQPPSHAQL